MDKLEISVLFYEDCDGGVLKHDEIVEEVLGALSEGGHKTSVIGVGDNLRELLDKLDDKRPDLVFNLCERFADNDGYELNVTAVLEMLGQPFTGAAPAGMALRQDKAITKKLLKFHGVQYPNYAIFGKGDIEFAGNMRFPLFVKPLHGDASLGIDSSSLVTEYTKLIERINFIHTQLRDSALVEEYIEGREFYVGVLGNDPVEVLPVMEFDFTKSPCEYPRIFSYEAKTNPASPQYRAVDAMVATELTPEIRARIVKAGADAAYALKVRDYGRVDIRLSPDGTPLVLEVNANPYLDQTSAFALGALQAGTGYTTLINRIVEIAWKRLEQTPFLKDLQKSKAEKARVRRQLEKSIKSIDKT